MEEARADEHAGEQLDGDVPKADPLAARPAPAPEREVRGQHPVSSHRTRARPRPSCVRIGARLRSISGSLVVLGGLVAGRLGGRLGEPKLRPQVGGVVLWKAALGVLRVPTPGASLAAGASVGLVGQTGHATGESTVLVRELLDAGRKAELLEARHAPRDVPEGEGDRTALAEAVDPEASESLGDRCGVEVSGRVEALALRRRPLRDLGDELVERLVVEDSLADERRQRGVDANHRRRVDLQMEVAAPDLDHVGEQGVEVHGRGTRLIGLGETAL